MKDLLPYYEAELAFMKASSQEFARQYPRVAGHLAGSADVAEDPHVARLIEAFSLLAARVHKRLDDDFPLFTETLLEVLYPHYLRPFPATSIARFELGAAAAQLSRPARVARGTLLQSRPLRGVPCSFRTAYEVELRPLRVADFRFSAAVGAPAGTRLPPSATAMLSLTLESLSPQATVADLLQSPLRAYVSGEPSRATAVREALSRRVVGVMLQAADPHAPWSGPYDLAPRVAGFDEADGLLDWDQRSHPAYRLLSEFFAFPEKFNFLDLALPPHAAALRGARRVTLHYLLGETRADSDTARLLETVDASQLELHCTPVVNLFRRPADPIRVSHERSAYPLVVDARRAWAYDVYSIDRVSRVRRTAQGETVERFRPFYSLQHEDLLPPGPGRDGPAPDAGTGEGAVPGRYWHARRDEIVAAHSPGYEVEIAVVDIDFDPAAPQSDTLSVDVSATNRDLPQHLPIGQPGGDLFLEGGSVAREIHLLRKPTAGMRFARDRGALWRLLSHLSLNHLSLSGGGLDALKEMLRLYDLPRSAGNRRLVDGLLAVEFHPATAWLPGEPYASFVRGTEVRLLVDESSFVGCGLHLFAQVMERFFALYVHLNSFTQLTLLSGPNRQEILKCPPRTGHGRLL
ncbi:MAG: type VI secretion system baseplate subunit TssF [Aquabacterium sp.]|nr:MAG: type VI secretion system baseplate subunit TssF [Aquabacterium sp.]